MKARIIINLVGFQLCWWLCVAYGNTWLLAAPLMWVVAQPLLLQHISGRREKYLFNIQSEYLLIAATVAIGAATESLLCLVGIWAQPAHFILPAWLLVLWALLAGCLYHSFAWLAGRLVLGGALAAISAPLSYIAGAALNENYDLVNGWQPLIKIALVWSLIFPLLLWLAVQFAKRQVFALNR